MSFASRNLVFVIIFVGCLAVVSCQTGSPLATPTPETIAPTPSPMTPRSLPVNASSLALPSDAFGYTHVRADGNRFAPGSGSLSPGHKPFDVMLSGKPVWVVGAPIDDGTVWAVVTDEGQTQIVQASGERVNVFAPVSSGAPPLLVNDGGPKLLGPPDPSASPLTHPVPLRQSDRIAFVNADGDVVIWDEGETARFEVNALPDARLLVDESDRLLLLTGATDRYAHGVLGDPLEASSVTIIETLPEPRIASTIDIPNGMVVEGISPIWADINGDGEREIIVTLSDSNQGAQVVVFDEDGERVAEGLPIGQGGRWRHQIALAPFGPNGEIELVDVRTPHIGGIIEYYRLEGDKLNIVAQFKGYTSHVIRSRNLDMAAAADFDGDGRVELLLPNQGFTGLGAIRRTSVSEGVETAWTLPVGGRITTNLAVVPLPDGGIAVAVGREDGVLRLWLP